MSSEVFHDWLIFFNLQCDIDNPQVDMNQLDDFCSKHNISGWWVKTKGISVCLVIVGEYLDHFKCHGKSLSWSSGLPIIPSMFLIYYIIMGNPGYKAIPALFSSLCVCVCVCTHNRNMHLILSLPVLHVCGLQQRLNGPIRGCWGYTCVCTAVS